MARYVFVVHSNPVAGREDEYNHWYSHEHLPALLRYPGMVSARRFVLAADQPGEEPAPYRYLALYELDIEQPQDFLDRLLSQAGTPELPTSSALSVPVSAVMWRAQS